MADTKISALTAATSAGTTAELCFNDSGTTKKITVANLAPSILTASGITSSVAELNLLDGSTAGTAVASKALVLGSNKEVTGLGGLELNNGTSDSPDFRFTGVDGTFFSLDTYNDTLRVYASYKGGETEYPFKIDIANNVVEVYGSKVWTAGNDGAGSGLDADLLDGLSSASFVRSDAVGQIAATGAAVNADLYENAQLEIVGNDGTTAAIGFHRAGVSACALYESGGRLSTIDNNGNYGAILDLVNCPSSLNTNGYQKLASGTIIQWGSYSSGAHGATITFPLAFPTAVRAVVANTYSGSNPAVEAVTVNNATVNGFVGRQLSREGATTSSFFWVAVGH